MDSEGARRFVDKVRDFAQHQLDSEERAMFALLVAPGVARAYPEDDDVQGFAMTDWNPQPLPNELIDALRVGGLRVVGLDSNADDQP